VDPTECMSNLTEEWKGIVNKIGFQFHNPLIKWDPLWLEFGELRNRIVDGLYIFEGDIHSS
jgi:Fe-coproporphyrin III synthase